ncbi:hypothetical protein D9M69_397930 [compost metagenome]
MRSSLSVPARINARLYGRLPLAGSGRSRASQSVRLFSATWPLASRRVRGLPARVSAVALPRSGRPKAWARMSGALRPLRVS